MNVLDEFALEAKMWWGLWWLISSVGILWHPAWNQCVTVAQGVSKKTWTLAIVKCPKFCPDDAMLLWKGKNLSQTLRSVDSFGHRTGGTTPLYIYWVEEAELPHAHLQKIIVVTWGDDEQHSWGALPSLNPPSQQCLCQQWQISCLILL